jgi:hypothetical protein
MEGGDARLDLPGNRHDDEIAQREAISSKDCIEKQEKGG